MDIENGLKVLAVGDPAVYAYTDSRFSLIEKFNKTRGVKVEFNIVPFDRYYETMMSTFNGEQDYDIVMVAGHLWAKDFINQGFLAEVQYPSTKEYNREDILDVIAGEMVVDGRPYLYPSFCDGHIFLYRKSVVSRVMNEQLSDVVDTDTILLLAEKCDRVDNMRAIALKAHQSEIFLDFLPYLRNEAIDAFDITSHAPSFNNEKGIIALKKYNSLKKYAPEDTHTYGNDEVRVAFQKKKVALTVTWGGQLGVVLNDRCLDIEDVGFAAIKTAWNVTWSFAISQRCKNKKLANEFLAYITSSEVDRIVGGYAGSPVRKSTYVKDAEKYRWYDTHLKLIEKYAKPLPMMDRAGEKMAPLYDYIYKALTGELDAGEALAYAEVKVKSVVN